MERIAKYGAEFVPAVIIGVLLYAAASIGVGSVTYPLYIGDMVWVSEEPTLRELVTPVLVGAAGAVAAAVLVWLCSSPSSEYGRRMHDLQFGVHLACIAAAGAGGIASCFAGEQLLGGVYLGLTIAMIVLAALAVLGMLHLAQLARELDARVSFAAALLGACPIIGPLVGYIAARVHLHRPA